MLAGPLFMLQIYDRVLSSRSEPTLLAFVLLIIAVYAFYAFIEALRSRMSLRLANLFDHTVGEKLFQASVRLRLATGQAATLDPVRDGDTLRNFLASPGPLSLLDMPWVPIYLAVVFVIHPYLGWLATGGAIVITAMMLINELALRKPSKDSSQAIGARQRQTDDARANAETILAMGMLGDVGRRWTERTRTMLFQQRISSDRATFFSSLTKATRLLLQSLVLGLGAWVVIHGDMTGGLMIAASVVTSRALAPIEQTIAQWRQFVSARQAYGRIKKYLTVSADKSRETRLPLPKALLSVRQLMAGPPGATTPIISGIQFELVAGDGMGVLGLSGSGKSSLARTLCGVWTPMSGEIRLDGALLQHYDPVQIGKIVGYLPQRADLFEGTVAENISRFAADAPSEDIIAAAQLANVHELVSSLPNGYDTPVGVNGDSLSAGQRQRVGLARALYGNPFLVVLDEPNANLDAEGDAALTDAIRAVRQRGGIVIVVAHRPSAVLAVDKLLFMKNGRQVVFGPKPEVLKQITGDNVQPMRVPGT
ncbi:MAG: type I secretion system permease/ATPase [Devosia nanyangense]|uniref:Type I secretion system permease/ATPase n=1 Tax=Devosia nanyangense TaxID=1228055 RepID=A0A933L1L4_9HYPH|nr:type I secretion system permease/ATPase [Devosia nanyangense]